MEKYQQEEFLLRNELMEVFQFPLLLYFVENQIEYRVSGELKNTDLITSNTFWIGVYPGINKEMLDYVLECFNEFLKDYDK